VSSERLDAVIAAFANLSRGQTDKLFAAEKVFVNGRMITDRSARLKEGDIFSVRGFGKAVYDGIEYETKKSRYMVRIRKLV
jgi:RNA-binding protein YlmH